MKKIKGIVLLVFMSVITTSGVNAGPGSGDDDDPFTNGPGGGGDPGEDPDIPLDPGTWVLAAAGVGYGVKKWRDAKQKNDKNVEEKTIDFLKDDAIH